VGEAAQLSRVIMLVGFLSLFGVLLYSANGPPPFANLSTFPVFNNPFTSDSYFARLLPSQPPVPFNAPAVGCDPNAYFNCLKTDDADKSYISVSFVNAANNCIPSPPSPPGACGDIIFYLQDGLVTPRSVISNAVVKMSCRSTSTTLARFVIFIGGGAVDTSDGGKVVYSCPQSGNFQGLTISLNNLIYGDRDPSNNYWSDTLRLQAGFEVCGVTGLCADNTPSGPFDVSYFTLEVTSSANPCPADFWSNLGGNTGCQIGRFVDTLAKAATFGINGMIFMGQWVVYVVTFFGDLATVLFWFLNVPGTPPVVQGLIDIMIMGLLGFFVYLGAKMVRGTGLVGL